MGKVITFRPGQKQNHVDEMNSAFKQLDKYFVLCENDTHIMCFHSDMELTDLLMFQKILNIYIDECFEQGVEYSE